MNKEDILRILNENPVFYLATCDSNKPHVRAMLLYSADTNGIMFHSGVTKDLCSQLAKNPEVELCFWSPKDKIQIRISGKVQVIDSFPIKQDIVGKRSFLKPWVEKNGYDCLVVYQLKTFIATTWTMETNTEPKKTYEF